MNKNTTALLIVWNVVLTALLAWSLLRTSSTDQTIAVPATGSSEEAMKAVISPRDSSAIKDARIAYFVMDSVQSKYEMVKEQGDRLRGEGKRLEGNLQREMDKAQGRYQELMQKDHTYSTQADIQKDEMELQKLGEKIQGLQASSEEQLGRMEIESLNLISKEIEDYLQDYNAVAGFDYIFSVQNGGQIWTGNENLDITETVVKELNKRHRAKKPVAKP
ncbi:MAG: OmpH family outer membrane protein [Flavobacteriales bacterium]|nr:OmpH family outer membrane protein [Flavobacteriales bacterium]MBK6946193.1 OmpH family outer membrane protein [Flavobacteriales bacterium]MBK7238854.1 OmpH family outer membrane protein [Flavobacteriales bacterium]MBK7297573.1 OmpH family outer membrane protein [Flavobacteriales bacterium]MBK9537021.1 OmpH family outer membrane protein [Flavobacteriales bacterium]